MYNQFLASSIGLEAVQKRCHFFYVGEREGLVKILRLKVVIGIGCVNDDVKCHF